MSKPLSKDVPPPPLWLRLRFWVYLGALTGALGLLAASAVYVHLDRSPGELMRYTERRLEGHTKLEWFSKPVFGILRPFIERPVTTVTLDPNVGPRRERLAPQRYDPMGRPIAGNQIGSEQTSSETEGRTVLVWTGEEMTKAIARAQPGDVIELQAGIYAMPRNIGTPVGGTPSSPIIVRGARPGVAIINSGAIEGFHINQPFWVFEDLVIRGKCSVHDYCEHAFHVTGAARGTVIRNNVVEDFNAHVKVNGRPPKEWPDDGLIQYNIFRNNAPRRTQTPVTPIDIVGADRWHITNNYVGHFVKDGSDGISYGIFMKGSGHDGLIEHNQIICTESNVSQAGARVGVSFGGGGTGEMFCRDGKCITEYSDGILIGNTIEHCNDFGVYINRSNNILIEGNVIRNTYGVDVRFPESSATFVSNIIEGRVRSRQGGLVYKTRNNIGD